MSELGKTLAECPACGEAAVSFREVELIFPFGSHPNQIEISARVPKGHCASCGLEFTDQQAERLRHEAVCRHFRLLTPKQIESLRKSWNMSRQRFAELTRIGEASLSRWERGAGLQNPALDQLLFLLGFADNMRRIQSRDADQRPPTNQDVAEIAHRFPNLKNVGDKQKESERFSLRCVGE